MIYLIFILSFSKEKLCSCKNVYIKSISFTVENYLYISNYYKTHSIQNKMVKMRWECEGLNALETLECVDKWSTPDLSKPYVSFYPFIINK